MFDACGGKRLCDAHARFCNEGAMASPMRFCCSDSSAKPQADSTHCLLHGRGLLLVGPGWQFDSPLQMECREPRGGRRQHCLVSPQMRLEDVKGANKTTNSAGIKRNIWDLGAVELRFSSGASSSGRVLMAGPGATGRRSDFLWGIHPGFDVPQ